MPIPQAFEVGDEAYLGDGVMANSNFMDGMEVEAAKAATPPTGWRVKP